MPNLLLSPYPVVQLSVYDRNMQYHVGSSWLAWDPTESYAAPLVGAWLLGPKNAVVGANAYLHSRSSSRRSEMVSSWTHPTEPEPTHLPRRFLILEASDHPYLIRHQALPFPDAAPKTPWLQSLVLPRSIQPDPPDAAIPDTRIIAHWGPADTWQHTVWLWLHDQPIPLDADWEAPFLTSLNRSDSPLTVKRLPEWRMPEAHQAPTLLRIDGLTHLDAWIRTGLQRRWWQIPDGFGPNADAPGTLQTPDDYLTAWAPALSQQLHTVVRPRLTAGQAVPDAWQALLRQPFAPAQSDIIQASSATLADPQGSRTVLIQGEPGTGKTLMMSIIPWDRAVRLQQRSGFRVLVVAPDHLLDKWEREILATIPEATTHRLASWQSVLAMQHHWRIPPSHPEYWIIGRDRAKLSYRKRFAGHWSPLFRHWQCPDCGKGLRDPQSQIAWPRKIPRSKRYAKCPHCTTPLWCAEPQPRRISPMHLLRRTARQAFDDVIFDEAHELLGNSEQGQLLAWGQSVGRRLILGTGTLSNGYATTLHALQYRIDPASMRAEGIAHADVTETQRRYGRIQTTTRTSLDDGEAVYGRRSTARKYEKVLPGISPLWYATKLVEKMLVIRLEDLGPDALPPYEESVQWVAMDDDQRQWHDRALATVREIAQAALRQGSRRLLSQMLMTSLTVPDACWRPIALRNAQNDAVDLLPPDTLTEGRTYPKERQIVQDVQAELQAGRRVWIYTTFTQKYPQADRLAQQLTAAGIRTAILTTDVPRSEREAWIARHVENHVQVVISHPGLVETGLDLYAFPSLFWNSTGYQLARLRQASRRAWRIGQTAPCRVRFYAYADTMEQTALELMAEKLEAARVLESDMSLEGLQRIAEAQGGSNQLVRALIDHGLDRTPDISQVWKVLQTTTPFRAPLAPALAATAQPSPLAIPIVFTEARPTKRRTARHAAASHTDAIQQLAWALPE